MLKQNQLMCYKKKLYQNFNNPSIVAVNKFKYFLSHKEVTIVCLVARVWYGIILNLYGVINHNTLSLNTKYHYRQY